VAVSALVPDAAGDLWCGTTTDGLFHVDWKSGSVVNYRHREGDERSITFDDIGDIALDPEGNLWIVTVKALDLFSPATGMRIPYLTEGVGPPGTAFGRLSVDRTGALWWQRGRAPTGSRAARGWPPATLPG